MNEVNPARVASAKQTAAQRSLRQQRARRKSKTLVSASVQTQRAAPHPNPPQAGEGIKQVWSYSFPDLGKAGMGVGRAKQVASYDAPAISPPDTGKEQEKIKVKRENK